MSEDSIEQEPFKGYEVMKRIVGKRHATCWFDNYEIGSDKYTPLRGYALKAAKTYAQSLKAVQESGKNIIFMGSIGTGKDHLAVSILRAACSLRIGTRFRRGSVLCSECRQHSLEKSQDVPYDLWNVELLVISDIEPHEDKPASEFEKRALLELIDRRYTAMLPTVVTTNKLNRAELSESIGSRAVDRLCQGAEIVPMSWPSHRE